MSRLHSPTTVEQRPLDMHNTQVVQEFAAGMLRQGHSDAYVLLRLTGRGLTDAEALAALAAGRRLSRPRGRRSGKWHMAIGLGVCIAGTAASGGAYHSDGAYALTYGLAVLGGVQMLIGLFRLIPIRKSEDPAEP